MNSKKLLGNRFRHMRRKSDLSQEKLAEMLGLDPNSISRIECGLHYPSMDTLEKFTKALRINMHEMFLDENQEIESTDEMRAYLIRIASELDDQELIKVVKIIRQII